ncbi:MAG: hypothetical protein V3T23_01835 [Nitrososphaerales archaeon]
MPKQVVQILIEFDGKQIRTKHPADPMLCIAMLSLALQEIYGKMQGNAPEPESKIIIPSMHVPGVKV